MRIGIIGHGMVGGALGAGWAKRGHEVIFGVRDPKSPKVAEQLAQISGNATAGSVTEAADAGEVVVLATPWDATEGVVKTLGDLGGKPLLDATNPLAPNLSGLTHGLDTSGGEMIAGWAEGAKVVKIFNTTGFNNMANPIYPEGTATMFYCGDDAGAKATAHGLAADLGFDPVDVGPLRQARLLEPLALLWISLAVQGLGRDVAFRLMRR
jgi:predicted dinucleotide-binding enzyme